MSNRIGGVCFIKADGVMYKLKGDWTYNLGHPTRETVQGGDNRVHGYKEASGEPMMEGEITDQPDLEVAALMQLDDVTVTLELANGKVIVGRNAWYAGDGSIGTGEGNINAKFVAPNPLEEIR